MLNNDRTIMPRGIARLYLIGKCRVLPPAVYKAVGDPKISIFYSCPVSIEEVNSSGIPSSILLNVTVTVLVPRVKEKVFVVFIKSLGPGHSSILRAKIIDRKSVV